MFGKSFYQSLLDIEPGVLFNYIYTIEKCF